MRRAQCNRFFKGNVHVTDPNATIHIRRRIHLLTKRRCRIVEGKSRSTGARIHPSVTTNGGGSTIAVKRAAITVAVTVAPVPWVFRAELRRALDLSDPGSGLTQIDGEEAGGITERDPRFAGR